MRKNSISSHNVGVFPSPGVLNFQENRGGIQKGWSSERVPQGANSSRRHISAGLMPFYSGRTLPSKWDDAERWICSPVSGNAACSKNSQPQPHRRPKSKSGPIAPPGFSYYSNYSPAVPILDGGGNMNMRGFFVPGSPFSAGVMVADGLSIQYGGGGHAYPTLPEHNVTRSDLVHGWSDLLSQLSSHSSQDEKHNDDTKDAETMVSRSRRDMATQMSPDQSNHSSPKHSPSALPLVELHNNHSSKLEVRDVPVDKRATVIRWSKKNGAHAARRGSPHVEDSTENATQAQAPSWEAAKNTSKLQKEEAKITSWENLQKAKAEAAIRKLEMKLEKKRLSSMDKILNKLRSAQMKAQDMRTSMSGNRARHVPKPSHNAISFWKHICMGSLSKSCFYQ